MSDPSMPERLCKIFGWCGRKLRDPLAALQRYADRKRAFHVKDEVVIWSRMMAQAEATVRPLMGLWPHLSTAENASWLSCAVCPPPFSAP